MKTSNHDITITSTAMHRRDLANKINLLEPKKFTELNNRINNSVAKLKDKYEELNDFSVPIEYNKKLFGLINKVDTVKSLNNIIGCIQNLAECTLDAFQVNGENLSAILDLMRVTAGIENDLYKQLEDSDCSKESIANLLNELCKQYNIDNKAIEGLFEQSFRRTITLRDRIKDLRTEIFERISKYEEKFENLDDTISKKEKEVIELLNNNIEEYNRQLKDSINKLSTAINKYEEELETAKKSYEQEIKLAKDELSKEIKKLHKRLIWAFIGMGIATLATLISIAF